MSTDLTSWAANHCEQGRLFARSHLWCDVAGIEPSSHPSKHDNPHTNGHPDDSVKHMLRHHNQPLLLADDSVVLECDTLGPSHCWTVQGDVKIEVWPHLMHIICFQPSQPAFTVPCVNCDLNRHDTFNFLGHAQFGLTAKLPMSSPQAAESPA